MFFRKAGYYSFSVDARSIVVHNSSWVTLHNLEPGQRYEIYVTGFTSKGDGPRSNGYFVITGTHCNQGFSFTVNVFSYGEMCSLSAVNANSAIRH